MKQKNVETQRERPLRRCRGQFKSVLDGGHWGRMPVDSRCAVASHPRRLKPKLSMNSLGPSDV
eukprot:3547128-Amphidinium_carterae.1